MTELRPLLLIALAAIVAAILSVAAGPNLGFALFSGALAAVAGGLIALLVLAERVRRTAGRVSVVESEILVTLRDAVTSGSIGRERVIAAVQSIEIGFGLERRVPIGFEEGQRLVALPQPEFRAWLSGQLDRLERET